jgi:hypothetical protein
MTILAYPLTSYSSEPDMPTSTRWATAITLSLASTVALVGCGTTLKRYTAAIPVTLDSSHVTVSAFSLPLPPQDPKTLLNLAERGQASAVAALASRTNTVPDFLAGLATPLETPAPLPFAIDRRKVRRRIVLSVRHQQLTLADRVLSLRVTITVDSPGARFLALDKLTTRYETADLGKVTTTNQAGFTGSLGVTRTTESANGGDKTTVAAAPSLGLSASRTVAEEVLLKQRYIGASGELSESTATILLEGVPGIDLSGNTLADIDFELPADTTSWRVIAAIEDLVEKDGKVQCPSYATLRYVPVLLPFARDYGAHVAVDYIVRHVVSGAETLSEGDDTIQLLQGSASGSDLVLIGKRDISSILWTVYVKGEVLRISNLAKPTRRGEIVDSTFDYLVFSNGSAARQFTRAIRDCGPNAFRNKYLFLADYLKSPLPDSAKYDLYAEPWDVVRPDQ